MATGTAAGTYQWTGAAGGRRTRYGTASGTYGWGAPAQLYPGPDEYPDGGLYPGGQPTAVGSSPKHGEASGRFNWTCVRAVGDNGIYLPADDRWRVIVQETRSAGGGPGEIVARDVVVQNLVVQRALSDGCDIQFDVDPRDPSVDGIYFKPWQHYIHLEKVMMGKRRIWASGIVQPSDVDPQSGVLHLKAKGFAAYPKGLPWLEDLNWLTNDAYEPVVEIWRHLQEDFPNGDLGVEIYPQESGIEMLPGYAFDGDLLNLNFFATFVRAVDKLDCGDYIDALARDIPFDYLEESQWNADRTDITKKIHLGYPRLGVIQQTLAFVINENVISAKPHIESEIDWISDVGVTGFFPGFEYSFELANADPNRLRRYLAEEDSMIDSNERAAAWAHRRLARRQTPAYWEQIIIDPNHPNAPRGTFDVGDTITVSGFMPWVGLVRQMHKIIAIQDDVGKNTCQLQLMAEGAFNYDQIFFPDGSANIISNPDFDYNLNGWTPTGPGWTWDGSQGSKALGSVKITADGQEHDLLTQPFGVSDFQIFPMAISVKCTGAVSSGTGVQLVAQFYDEEGDPTQAIEIAALTPAGSVPWRKLGGGSVLTPVGSTHVAMRLHISSSMTAGTVWFDDAELTL